MDELEELLRQLAQFMSWIMKQAMEDCPCKIKQSAIIKKGKIELMCPEHAMKFLAQARKIKLAEFEKHPLSKIRLPSKSDFPTKL